jgi:protein-S-isoprenylcysteine O-methyltransferase Ste14
MRRAGAALGSAVFFALAPGVVAGLVPWWLTGWQVRALPAWWLPLRLAGVVRGLYRYVRNPMYLAVLAAIVGQALALGQVVLLPYAAVVAAAFVAFVHWYEEPTLARQFGDRYQAYRRAVPGWWPRRHPWSPAGDGR